MTRIGARKTDFLNGMFSISFPTLCLISLILSLCYLVYNDITNGIISGFIS